jgi:hypothetical protein
MASDFTMCTTFVTRSFRSPDAGPGAFFHHVANTLNHFASAASIRDDISEQLAKFARIDIATITKRCPALAL